MFTPILRAAPAIPWQGDAFLGLTLDTTRQQSSRQLQRDTHEIDINAEPIRGTGGTPIAIIRACGGPANPQSGCN